MNALWKKAISDVTRRKLRTALTVLGIAIGVMGLTAINLASNQLGGALLYSTDASVHPDIEYFTTAVTAKTVADLTAQPNVKFVQTQVDEAVRWNIPSGHEGLTIVGVTNFQQMRFNPTRLVSGSYPGAGEIALEQSDTSLTSVHIGDDVTFMLRGQTQRLRVSGFVSTRGLPSPAITGSAFGYMNEAAEESLFQLTGANDIQIKVINSGQRAATARTLASVLTAQHVSVLSAQVGANNGNNTTQIVNGLFGIMRVLSIIALLLSVFLMLSTITTLIAEQLPIIGTMKAIGAQSGQILRNYLASVALYGVLGTTLGLALGLLGGYVLSSYLGSLLNVDIGPFSVTPSLILVGVGVGIGVPLIAAIIPIALGTRITVRQAMSGYGLDGGAGGKGGKAGKGGATQRVGATPQTVKLGARSLFRKRTRAALTLLALAISGTAFLAVQTTSYSFDSFLTNVLGVYQADVWVNVTTPIPFSKAQALLATTPGVARAEPMAQTLVQSHWGATALEGIAPDAQIYHHEMVSGRWFTASDQNVVVLSEAAANKTGLKPGDTLPFHDDLHSANWRVIGVAHDNNDLGLPLGVILAPIGEVTSFQHLPADYVETILLTSTDKHQPAIDALAARLDNDFSDAGYQASVETTQQIVQQNQSQFQIISLLLYTAAVIIALVGAISLFNTLAMSVLERRREIGILRSMGATGGKVAQVFWTEGVSLGVIAWAIAIVLGIPAAYGFVQLLGVLLVAVPFAFNPMSLVWMLAFVVVVATLASLGPVWGATRVKIAQTLRYE